MCVIGDGYVSSFFGGEGLGMKYTATNDDCRVWIQSKNMNALIDTVARAAGPPAATPAETVENTIVKAAGFSLNEHRLTPETPEAAARLASTPPPPLDSEDDVLRFLGLAPVPPSERAH